MSLQVWLPLNGDLNNQGLSDIIFTGTPAWRTPGKIGASALNLSSRVTFNCPKLNGVKYFSVCFWGMTESNPDSTANWMDLFALSDKTADGTAAGTFRFETGYGNTAYGGIHWHDNATNAIINGSCTYNTASEWGQWHHICVTISDTEVRSYYDGVLKQTHTSGLGGGFITGAGWIGETTTRGGIQDIRIYDHALSAKEVKEISKGLVLHMPLSAPGGENMIDNSMPTSLTGWNRVGTGWSNSLVDCTDNATGKAVRSTYSGSGNTMGGIYHHIYGASKDSYENGAVYTLTVRVRASKDCNVSIRNELSGVNNYVRVTTNWQTITFTHSVNTSLSSYANIIYVAADDVVDGMWIECSWMKLEKGDHATPWVPHSTDALYTAMGFNDGIEYDVSGNGYNGTTDGITHSSDTARYNTSTSFDGIDDLVLLQNFDITNIINNQCTISFWIKPNGETNARSVYFGAYAAVSWSIEKSAANKLRLYWNGDPDIHTNLQIVDDQWQHIVITKNGTNDVKVYLNGVLIQSITTNHPNKTFGTTWRLGRDQRTNDGTPYKGLMSDFRIYATALSAEDILALYNTPESLTNTGTLLTQGEFSEVE